MQRLLANLRFAFRMIRYNPGFTTATVLTLALGIGANTAIFSVTDAVLLRPFPYRDPAQLVAVQVRDRKQDRGTNPIRYEFLRDHAKSFEQVGAWSPDNLNLTGDNNPVQVPVVRVSPGFFSMLGVQPALGRDFIAEEGRPEGKPVVILGNAFWHARYHGDSGIVGKTINLDQVASTVVGVLPANVQFPFAGPADVWTPRYFEYSLMPTARLRQGVEYLQTLARLKPGVTLQQANAELTILNEDYRKQNPSLPDANTDMSIAALPLRDLVVGDLRDKVLILLAAVGVVLLIACGNVASLMLSRALARRREVAVRAALGAARATILGQLLTESLVLALMAGTLGAVLGWGGTRALMAWGADQLPQDIPVGMDLRVLAFTLGISVLAGLLFGIAPALQLASVDLNSALREEGRGASAGRGRTRLKDLLVVGQVALSLVLLIGAGLLMRSFVRLLEADPGFEPHNVLTMNISLSSQRYAKPDQQIAFFDDVLRRVSAVPGVRSAAISAALPLSYIRITPVLPEGQPQVPLAQRPFVDIEAVGPGWFDTMHVPLRAGRAIDSGDRAQSPPVIVVNESFARQYWPGENALDKHVILGKQPVPALVVGVAADVKNRGLEQDPQAQIYFPFAQIPWGEMNLIVRTAVPPQTLAATIRAQIAAIDPNQPVTKIQTVDELMDKARTQPRFLLALVGAFSATALILAIIGIYGVLSYSVAERQYEFGIRLAMGAEREDILRLVLRHGFVLALFGIGVGLAGAFALTRLMGTMLYKTGGHDPLTFVAAPLVFLGIALGASYLPARRATRVSPMETLR
ncbi:MAG TPA: ABC transporter permease [Terracidiphilus sp.]|nr:ABC transporter permease [Terracidiphilus sp.]